jgi:hypothetical protein
MEVEACLGPCRLIVRPVERIGGLTVIAVLRVPLEPFAQPP